MEIPKQPHSLEIYEMKKEERSKQGQTNNKAEQHSTPKAVTFPKKNELPRVGLKPTTLYTLHIHIYCIIIHVHVHVHVHVCAPFSVTAFVSVICHLPLLFYTL